MAGAEPAGGASAAGGVRCRPARRCAAAPLLLALAVLLAMAGTPLAQSCDLGTQYVYVDNKDYLLAKCGANPAVAQLLQCTAAMVVAARAGAASPGACDLTYTPVLALGTLRALPLFPCQAFSYAGVGRDATAPASLGLQVNTSQLCAYLAGTNRTGAGAKALEPFCDASLAPAQRQAVALGRCLSPPRFKVEQPPEEPRGDGGAMARTIGLSVGLVLAAAGLGLGIAAYFVRRTKLARGDGESGSGSGPWLGGPAGGGGGGGVQWGVPTGGGLGRLGRGGGGGGLGSGPGVRYGGGGGGGGGGGLGFDVDGSGGAGSGLRGAPPQPPRQPPLEAQLQAQAAARAAAQASHGDAPAAGAPAAALPMRVHRWRPGRESAFASLLEEGDEGAAQAAGSTAPPPQQLQPQQQQPGAAPQPGPVWRRVQ